MKLIGILLLFYTPSLFSQSLSSLSFRDYPVVQNLDSLEQSIATKKSSPEKYLFGLITLERSRAAILSYKSGKDLPAIEAANRKLNLPNVKAACQYLYGMYVNANGYNRLHSYDYIAKALSQFEQQKDTTGMIECYFKLETLNISSDGTAVGSLNMGEYYFRRLSALADASSWIGDKLLALYAAQKYYYHFYEKYADSLQAAAQKALGIIHLYPGFGYMKVFVTNCLANSFYQKQKFSTSLKLHLECLDIVSSQSYIQLELLYFNVGNDYYYINNWANAEACYRRAIEFDSLMGIGKTYADALFALSNALGKQRKYRNALETFNLAYEAGRVIEDTVRSREFLELQPKYETDKKEQANLALQKEKQSYKVGIFISLVLLSTISLLLFYLYRKNKQLDEYAHFRDQIFTIISHDLRSPVMSLEGLSKQASFLLKQGQMDTLKLVSEKIDTSVLNMNGLLNNLLAWAISQNTKMETKTESFPLLSLVNEILLLYTEVANAKGIAITVNIAAGLTVRANKNGLAVIIRGGLINGFGSFGG